MSDEQHTLTNDEWTNKQTPIHARTHVQSNTMYATLQHIGKYQLIYLMVVLWLWIVFECVQIKWALCENFLHWWDRLLLTTAYWTENKRRKEKEKTHYTLNNKNRSNYFLCMVAVWTPLYRSNTHTHIHISFLSGCLLLCILLFFFYCFVWT